jgi:Uma2 family endonuclease
MATQRKLMTADEFFCLPDDGMRHELVRGEVTTSPPPGPGHGNVGFEIGFVLGGFIRQHRLGHCYAAETGFWIESDPDTVRAPDFAFVSFERLPGRSPERWPEGLVPDLVVEVVSPAQSIREVRDKMENWIRTGVRLGIAAHPRDQTIDVYQPAVGVKKLGPDDLLDGAQVLPGFSWRVLDLFPH